MNPFTRNRPETELWASKTQPASAHLTEGEGIGINYNGRVVVKTAEAWVKLGWEEAKNETPILNAAVSEQQRIPLDKIVSVTRAFDYTKPERQHIPWVQVFFPPDDWASRDSFAASIAPNDATSNALPTPANRS